MPSSASSASNALQHLSINEDLPSNLPRPSPTRLIAAMATVNGGYTTGASREDAELHRRNVTTYEKANGSHGVKLEADDTKKLQKVGRCSQSTLLGWANNANSLSQGSSRFSMNMSSSLRP